MSGKYTLHRTALIDGQIRIGPALEQLTLSGADQATTKTQSLSLTAEDKNQIQAAIKKQSEYKMAADKQVLDHQRELKAVEDEKIAAIKAMTDTHNAELKYAFTQHRAYTIAQDQLHEAHLKKMYDQYVKSSDEREVRHVAEVEHHQEVIDSMVTKMLALKSEFTKVLKTGMTEKMVAQLCVCEDLAKLTGGQTLDDLAAQYKELEENMKVVVETNKELVKRVKLLETMAEALGGKLE